ncbi:PREDICTED: uncharacterized protein LOC108506487 [Lepidothrix coronata]|uniref:Uncharacterized protein LOC108506487 n=1 Tax=Lepidothrix coronata TaxID=321398 RepID=A0A6J0IQT1_9PASS|nr:PREDICTED: uncharacterized protein LOC108506487 [Lepidothrix coronata]
MKYMRYKPVGPGELPTLKELSNSEIWKIWSGASRYIHRQLLQKKAVEIGVGTFAIVPVHASVEEGKVLTVERPVFITLHTLPFLPLAVSVLDPVFLARRRVSQASQQSMEPDQPKHKEAGRGGFLPGIQEKTDKMLIHPTPQSESRSKLPECAPRPSAMGMHSLYNEREERELQLLMASRRHEVEGEVWRKYFGNRTRQETEQGQTSCPYVFEDPYRPPYLLRKAYAEKLKEKGRSTARQSTLEQQEELQLPRKVLEDKGVQTGLLEHRWDGPGTASLGKKM